jgi:vacuolar protein sorting-associated protein 33A
LEVGQIKSHAAESQKHTYTLLLVPRTSTLITRVLEEEGVLGDVTISSYNLQFIPIADDVISLENSETFKEIWVVGWTFLLRHCSCDPRDSGWRRDLYL